MSALVMPFSLKLILLATALAAAYYDLRVRRIPNWINLTGVILGFGLNTYFQNLHGTLVAIGGLLVAFCVYFPLYLLKGMGAGDVKLMAAIGAIVGPGNWFDIFLVTALLGGVASLVLVFWRNKIFQTLQNVSVILTQLVRLKPPVEQDGSLSIHSDKSLKMPHGAIIAAGVCLFLAINWK